MLKLEEKVALVTGGNKGIGFQIARELLAHGFTVLVGARNLERGEEAAKSLGAQAHALQLDVTNHDSVTAAAKRIRSEFGRLDVLVNNAGISHAGRPGRPLAEVAESIQVSVAPVDEIYAVFETNVFGVIAVTQAMLPLLREAPQGRIVNVSSSLGSLAITADPATPKFGIYSVSKTALNAITLAFANELETTNIKVNAVCPGYTATDLNNFEGTRTVEQAAQEPVRLALIGADGPNGSFSDENGTVPW